jgi:hypothetical protein
MWDFDGWSQNGEGVIYFYNDWRCHTDWGDTRFDYGRGEVRQYLCDNALRWLEITAFDRSEPRASDRLTPIPKMKRPPSGHS